MTASLRAAPHVLRLQLQTVPQLLRPLLPLPLLRKPSRHRPSAPQLAAPALAESQAALLLRLRQQPGHVRHALRWPQHGDSQLQWLTRRPVRTGLQLSQRLPCALQLQRA